MRLQPLIPGTVALWQLQSDTNDSSGNALHLSSVVVATNAPAGPTVFAHMSNRRSGVVTNDPCLMGADLTNSPGKLMAPVTPLLQLTGPMTIEWLYIQRYTNTHAYFACADPAGRVGGAAPDRIGSLYTMWSINGDAEISDKHIGSNLPSPGYGWMGNTNATWATFNLPNATDYSTHHMAYVRDGAGNWNVYLDGALSGVGVLSAGANASTGAEQFFMGAIELEANVPIGVFASVRVLNYARSAALILADALSCLGTCVTPLQYRGIRIGLRS